LTSRKRCVNGSVSRKAKRIWTPVWETRSSWSSSLKLRSSRSVSVSWRPGAPSCDQRLVAQLLLADLQLAGCGEHRRQPRIAHAGALGPDDPVAAAPVPLLQELLARMRPLAGGEQLELDRAQSALAAVAFNEVEQRAAHAGPLVRRRGHEQPELAHPRAHVVD